MATIARTILKAPQRRSARKAGSLLDSETSDDQNENPKDFWSEWQDLNLRPLRLAQKPTSPELLAIADDIIGKWGTLGPPQRDTTAESIEVERVLIINYQRGIGILRRS